MWKRERPGQGDIYGPAHGDPSTGSGQAPSARLRTGFTDWDNPEDKEEVPEDYYDDDEAPDDEELCPDDPDYDLSEMAGYAGWEPPKRQSFLPRWVIVAVSLLLILALLLPALRWLS